MTSGKITHRPVSEFGSGLSGIVGTYAAFGQSGLGPGVELAKSGIDFFVLALHR